MQANEEPFCDVAAAIITTCSRTGIFIFKQSKRNKAKPAQPESCLNNKGYIGHCFVLLRTTRVRWTLQNL